MSRRAIALDGDLSAPAAPTPVDTDLRTRVKYAMAQFAAEFDYPPTLVTFGVKESAELMDILDRRHVRPAVLDRLANGNITFAGMRIRLRRDVISMLELS